MMWRPTTGFAVLALTTSATCASTDARIVMPDLAPRADTAGIRLAATKLYRLVNPLPFPVQVRILGSGPGFPQVVTVPIGGVPVPIPYPDLSMPIQIKQPGSGWSPKLTIPWKPGPITLPGF